VVTVHWDIDKRSKHIPDEELLFACACYCRQNMQKNMASKLCMPYMRHIMKTTNKYMKKEDKKNKERRLGA
jgi:hypothetical protein